MTETVSLIPNRLHADPEFRADISNVAGLDAERLQLLRSLIEDDIGFTSTEGNIGEEDLAKLGVDRTAGVRLMYTLHFLVARLVESPEADVDALVDEVVRIAGKDIDDAGREALAKALKPTPEQRTDRMERNTFAFGDTFLGIDVVPIYAHAADQSIQGGASLSIRYRSADNQRHSLSINASAVELSEMVDALSAARRDLEAGLTRLRAVAP